MEIKKPFGGNLVASNPFAAREDQKQDDAMARFDDALADTVLARLPTKPVAEKMMTKYKFINGLRREALSQLIDELPAPDTTIYILSNGAGAERQDGSDREVFDFGAFIPVLVGLAGGRCDVFISTWTMNRRGALALADMLRRGEARRLVLAIDQYFNKRSPDIAKILYDAMIETGRGDYITFRNHAKVLAIANENGCVVVTGSANLSSQPRIEQYTLTTSPDVFEFFKTNLFHWAIAQAKNRND